MPPTRAAIPLGTTAVLVAAVLAGCGTVHVSSQLPSGEHLAGDWKLDSAHSDDLGRAVEELRAQQAKARHGMTQGTQQQQGLGGYGGRRHGGGGEPQGGQQGGEDEQGESASGTEGIGPGMGALAPRASAVDELMANVPQGDYLRITVSASAFTVVSGDSTDEYTPGVVSDISAEQGDAQQITGWHGTDYVIDTKPQFGAEIVQTYSVTKDGTLSMTLKLTGAGTRFTFTRIYDRTTGVTPLAPPTIN